MEAQLPPPKGDTAPALPPNFRPMSVMALDGLRYATWYGGRPRPRRHCDRRNPAPPKIGSEKPHVRPMSIVVKRLNEWRYHLGWI